MQNLSSFLPIHLKLTILLLLLFLQPIHTAWQNFTTFTGYLPSYIYSITLSAGDTLRGHLSWPGTQDLDIYLYSQGMDLLKMTPSSAYIKREFSQYNNPEILDYVATGATKYYLRIDLYSNVPTPYQFNITVNGEILSNNFDTVIKVDAGRTAQQFSVNGPCQIRVIYDGPIKNIYLFAPGVNVITGTPTASDTTNINPKQLTASLSTGGLWSIVVHHGITSTTVLTPFSIVVQTEPGASECTNFCSGIQFSAGMIVGYGNACRCLSGYEWVAANTSCSIKCGEFNGTGGVGARVDGASDQCACLLSGYKWDSQVKECVVDCSSKNNTVQYAGNNTCQCIQQFYWDSQLKQCLRDCTNIPNTVQTPRNPSQYHLCPCRSNFLFSPTTLACQIDCPSIPHSVPIPNNIEQCQCQPSPLYTWNRNQSVCQIDCSQVVNVISNVSDGNGGCFCAVGYYLAVGLGACVKDCSGDPYAKEPVREVGNLSSFDVCVCQQYFQVNPNNLLCEINCSLVPNSASPTNNTDQCFCVPQFFWLFNLRQCSRNCTPIPYTLQLNRSSPSNTIPFDQCQCQDKFTWNRQRQACIIDCLPIADIQPNGAHGDDYCQCRSGFHWDANAGVRGCVIECQGIPYAVEPDRNGTGVGLDQCLCQGKFQWDIIEYRCEINCSGIENVGNETLMEIDQCSCRQKFIWYPTLLQCMIDCQTLPYTDPTQNQTSLTTCPCHPNFNWNPTHQHCQILCQTLNHTVTNLSDLNTSTHNFSQLNQSLTNLTHQECLCEEGFVWSQELLLCRLEETGPEGMGVVRNGAWGQGGVCGGVMWAEVGVGVGLGEVGEYTVFEVVYGDGDGGYVSTMDWLINGYQYIPQRNSINFTFTLQSPPTSNTFHLKLSTPTHYIYTPINLPSKIAPSLYTASQCSTTQSIQTLLNFTVISAYAAMGLSLASMSYKIIGLQMLGILQLAYFSVTEHYEDINVMVYPMRMLRVSNGAILQYIDEEREQRQREQAQVSSGEGFRSYMPGVVKTDAGIGGYLVNNFNVMFLVMIGYGVVCVGVYGVAGLYGYVKGRRLRVQMDQHEKTKQNLKQDGQKQKQKQSQVITIQQVAPPQPFYQTIQKTSLKFLKQGILTFLLFSTLNISYSSTIFQKYCIAHSPPNSPTTPSSSPTTPTTALILSQLILYTTLTITIAITVDFARTGVRTARYGEFKSMFKYNWVCRMYVLVIVGERVVLGVVMAGTVDGLYGSMFAIGVTLVVILYMGTNLPYTSTLHNYRSSLIHLTQLITLLTANYYRTMKSNTPLPLKSHMHTPAILMLSSIALCILFSIAVTLWEAYRRVRRIVRRIVGWRGNAVGNLGEGLGYNQRGNGQGNGGGNGGGKGVGGVGGVKSQEISSKREISRVNNVSFTQQQFL